MTDHTFCRSLLRATMEAVKEATTPDQRREAWGYKYDGSQQVEFHGPAKFYWHGRGCCVWHARHQGWTAWLDNQGIGP